MTPLIALCLGTVAGSVALLIWASGVSQRLQAHFENRISLARSELPDRLAEPLLTLQQLADGIPLEGDPDERSQPAQLERLITTLADEAAVQPLDDLVGRVSSFRDLERRYERLLTSVWQLFPGPALGLASGLGCAMWASTTPPFGGSSWGSTFTGMLLIGSWLVGMGSFALFVYRDARLVREVNQYGVRGG